ncbi:hypothetical protein ALT_1446 [Aspergillus lentulus]|uniref:Phytocyanin domain-containing protein n=1 Tax=Aspergillus lentulus TaxID=293939 RepID=A0AAN4PCE9_ASPLE|nr:hypothetical protein ALT_1446 [Aspergillus lentulus]
MTGAMNLILAILWLPLIYAQSGAVHTVDVGEHGFTFDPDTLSVSPGDKVEFHFYPGDHSVAQAAFSKPCHPLNQSSFFSGFIPATNGESHQCYNKLDFEFDFDFDCHFYFEFKPLPDK